MKSTYLRRGMLLLGALSLLLLSARLRSGITISENSAQLDFPRKLTFKLTASSASEISELYLLHKTSARSCSEGYARQQVKDFTPGKEVSAEWTWDFLDSGGLPPGAEITWQWEARTSAGETLTSASQTLVLEDERYDWKTLSQDGVTVLWAEGSQAFGQALLQTSLDSLKRIKTQAGVNFDGEVRIDVYPTFDDLRGALLYEPEWVGGQTFTAYDIIMTAVEPGQPEWMNDVIPHELAHVITTQATFNCVGASLSTWLSEGLAQIGEGDLPEETEDQTLEALQNGSLPSLISFAGGFPDDPEKANQAYDFSYVIVDYLVKTYGSEAMGQVLDAIQAGKLSDQALVQVYGLDTQGIDQAWRAANGVGEVPEPVKAGEATATPARSAIPTLALWTQAFDTPKPPAAESAALPAATKTSPTLAPPTGTSAVLAATSAPEQNGEGGSPLYCLGVEVGLPAAFLFAAFIHRRAAEGAEKRREKN